MAVTVPEQRRGATTEPLLRVEALSVRFAAFNTLIDVDLEIRLGETVALAGENGAGKSTLIRCIGGDIAPTGGRIYRGGERVSSSPAAAARRGIAVVWQDLALCDNLPDVHSSLTRVPPRRVARHRTLRAASPR
jgi:D-xylose transport system ATP-binding protein